jgi:hypothetical protein
VTHGGLLIHDAQRPGEQGTQAWWPVALGIVAGLCTSFSFVPRLIKVWRDGDTEVISKRIYLVSLAAYSLWVVENRATP